MSIEICDPDFAYKVVKEVYSIEVNGLLIEAVYTYIVDDEVHSGHWDYDLTPAFESLTKEEVELLEEQFQDALDEINYSSDEKEAQEADDNSWRA